MTGPGGADSDFDQWRLLDSRARAAERERDAARAELADARRALDEAGKLHRPVPVATVGGTDTMCAECRREPRRWDDVTWPCPTAKALALAASRPSPLADTEQVEGYTVSRYDDTLAALQPRLDESDAAWVMDQFIAPLLSPERVVRNTSDPDQSDEG